MNDRTLPEWIQSGTLGTVKNNVNWSMGPDPVVAFLQQYSIGSIQVMNVRPDTGGPFVKITTDVKTPFGDVPVTIGGEPAGDKYESPIGIPPITKGAGPYLIVSPDGEQVYAGLSGTVGQFTVSAGMGIRPGAPDGIGVWTNLDPRTGGLANGGIFAPDGGVTSVAPKTTRNDRISFTPTKRISKREKTKLAPSRNSSFPSGPWFELNALKII